MRGGGEANTSLATKSAGVGVQRGGRGGRESEGEGRGRVDPARGLMSCLMGHAPQSPRSPAPAPSPG